MLVQVDNSLPEGVTAKDIILAIIGEIGTAGGTGHVIEYAGQAITDLSMEGRMTVCNMSIEGGARAGLVAPDEKAIEYLKGRPMAPKDEHWDQAVAHWLSLQTDEGAHFDKVVRLDAQHLPPIVLLGLVAGRRGVGHRQRAGSGRDRGREQAGFEKAGAGIYGPDGRHQNH